MGSSEPAVHTTWVGPCKLELFQPFCARRARASRCLCTSGWACGTDAAYILATRKHPVKRLCLLCGRLSMQSWGSMELGCSAATSAAMADAGLAGAPQPGGAALLQPAGGAPPAFSWPGGMPPEWPAWPAPARAAPHRAKASAGALEASRATGSSMLSGGSGASALTVGVAQLGSRRPSHSVDMAG